MKFRKKYITIFWRTIPYLSLLISTTLFSWLAYLMVDKAMWNNWLLSISANIASVFFLYFLYETIKARSEKELKKEIFEYAKSDVDRDVYYIIHNLAKFFYGFQRGRMLSQTFKLLHLPPEELERLIKNRKFIGFELFKSWDEVYDYFSKILENTFVLNRLNDDQISVVLHMRNILTSIKRIFDDKSNFNTTKQKVTNYKIVKGEDISQRNKDYPNRYLLLRILGGEKTVVEDFGDFSAQDAENLLDVYIVNEKAIEPLVIWSLEMFRHIKKWLELTGDSLHIA